MTQLTPMEVLATLQHAQLRLGRDFTREEFVEGKVGNFMLPEDFKPEETVSNITYTPIRTQWALFSTFHDLPLLLNITL